jgi:hypothetical protein
LVLKQRNECDLIRITHNIMNSDEYQLNRKYMRNSCTRYKLALRILFIFRKFFLFVAYSVTFLFTIIAYFDSEMNFSIIIMSIWLALLMISFYYTASFFFIAGVYNYVFSLYMKYRFQQVQDLIDLYFKRGNSIQKISNIDSIHVKT